VKALLIAPVASALAATVALARCSLCGCAWCHCGPLHVIATNTTITWMMFETSNLPLSLLAGTIVKPVRGEEPRDHGESFFRRRRPTVMPMPSSCSRPGSFPDVLQSITLQDYTQAGSPLTPGRLRRRRRGTSSSRPPAS